MQDKPQDFLSCSDSSTKQKIILLTIMDSPIGGAGRLTENKYFKNLYVILNVDKDMIKNPAEEFPI